MSATAARTFPTQLTWKRWPNLRKHCRVSSMVREYKYMCSDPGQELIKKDIDEDGLTRVVVSSCSPLMHEETFRNACEDAGLNRFLFQMSNIREQCSWVHADRAKATAKAKRLIAAAVRRVRLSLSLEERKPRSIPIRWLWARALPASKPR